MNRVIPQTVIFICLAIMLAACGGGGEVSFSTANIQNARLAKDEAGSQTTTTFGQEDAIYLLADLNNAPDETTIKAVWMIVEADGQTPNSEIDTAELVNGSGDLTFSLSPSGLWPNGAYKVDLYLNDELDQSLTYTVEGPVEAAAPVEEDVADNSNAAEETAVVPPNSGAIANVSDVRHAVIQIQAEGTFQQPDGIAVNAAGRGSGFIIDPSGLAVTNNHVVTGAALLKVWLDGENEPRNARVLGVSECSDLAVIDIEGDGFDYLDWYNGDIRVGNEVYVAGFPLGDPEYTLTRGIVSKENANGQRFSWSSVDSVIEYDAQAVGGNSGGPVVNNDGQVVAVHYASSRLTDDQAYGIASPLAQAVVDQLMAGNDVHSIGINGESVISEDGSLFGIWVSSVKSGSPADAAGIRPGDLIRQLEGLVLATDGSMADYCDILRSRNPEDTMTFSVWRLSTGEILEGQLNGRDIELVGMIDGGGQQSAGGGNNTGGAEPTGNLVTVTDDSGQLNLAIPASWGQVDGSAWVNDSGENLGIRLVASPDVNGFLSSWSTPGVRFSASDSLGMGAADLIDLLDFSGDCTYDGRQPYSDQVYTGQMDVYTNCGGQGAMYVVLTAEPSGGGYVVLLEVQLVTDADAEAFQAILDSFIVQ